MFPAHKTKKAEKMLGQQCCPKCGTSINVKNSLIIDEDTSEIKLFCRECGNIFSPNIDESVKRTLWSDHIKEQRKERKLYGVRFKVEEANGKVMVKERWFACPNCGASDDDVSFYLLYPQTFVKGWFNSKGEFCHGSPIFWDFEPGKALCLNCGQMFRVEKEYSITIKSEINNLAELQMNCPQCGYPWISFGRYSTYKRIERLRQIGVFGFRCLACGASFYYILRDYEAPEIEPYARMVKILKYRRELGSWRNYRGRFKTSVYGPYSWKEHGAYDLYFWRKHGTEAVGEKVGKIPEKPMVRRNFKGFLSREMFSITRSSKERRQVDFETRIQPMIELVLENECFSRQKNRIIEDVLRFTRYLWLNFSKQGRTSEYIVLAVMHYVYAWLALEAEPRFPKRVKKSIVDKYLNESINNNDQRESFPLERFWRRLAPNKPFSRKTYEKNVDWVLDCLHVARFKSPKAFKFIMFQFLED